MYGNCQGRVLSRELAAVLGPVGYAVRFRESHRLGRKAPPTPTAADLAACTLLLEQVDEKRFPGLDELPSQARVVRFPALDSNLLWPFSAINPYDLPEPPALEGAYPYGDRILQRCIESDWPIDRIVDYYFNHYPDYRLDMDRIGALERARREKRDRSSDVKMADALEDLVSAPLFQSKNHPKQSLMRLLLARIAAACESHIPEFGGPAMAAAVRGGFEEVLDWSGVPINPGVASELGLSWFDSRGSEEYVRGFLASAFANRARQRARGTGIFRDEFAWRPPLEGPVRVVGPAVGIYPDGFAAPRLRFELEAEGPVECVTVEGYYPPQHLRAATVVCTLGASKAEAMIEPGTAFSLMLPERLARGERSRFALTCSQTLNMYERGEGDDDRDLGVLILKMRAA